MLGNIHYQIYLTRQHFLVHQSTIIMYVGLIIHYKNHLYIQHALHTVSDFIHLPVMYLWTDDLCEQRTMLITTGLLHLRFHTKIRITCWSVSSLVSNSPAVFGALDGHRIRGEYTMINNRKQVKLSPNIHKEPHGTCILQCQITNLDCQL